jgi:hypothetical protein
MAKPKLTEKEESFVQAYIFNKCNLIEAYRGSLYSQNLTPDQMSVQANKLFNKPKLNLRIAELQKEADKIAKEAFTITVKQRLEWLKEITEAGLSTYEDQLGNKRREGLGAARSAIESMNAMLGVGDDDSSNADALTINFQVSPAVKEVKITNANN